MAKGKPGFLGACVLIFGIACVPTAAMALMDGSMAVIQRIGAAALYLAIGAACIMLSLSRMGVLARIAGTQPDGGGPEPTAGSAAPGDMFRAVDHALSVAEGRGIDVSGARAVMDERGVEESSDRLSAGGGADDDPLLVAKLVGKTLNVRYWRLRGKPEFELDMDVESDTLAYAKADGERIV